MYIELLSVMCLARTGIVREDQIEVDLVLLFALLIPGRYSRLPTEVIRSANSLVYCSTSNFPIFR